MKNIILIRFSLLIFILIILQFVDSYASDWTITALDNPAPGYLQFDWPSDPNFFCVDNYGNKLFRDTNTIPTKYIHYKLLTNGLWIRDGKEKFYLFNQSMQLVDSIPFPSKYQFDFHDVIVLPNGHYLIMCIENVPIDLSQIVKGGKTNADFQSCVLVETDRTGTVFWDWHAIYNIDVTNVTPDVDLTQQTIDFTHANSLTQDNRGDYIVSFRNLDEIMKISHLNGQVMWEMGGSLCKNNYFKFTNDSLKGFTGFTHQHSVFVLPNGNLLMYDNGNLKNPQYSRAVEYKIDEVKMTVTKVWEYRYSPDIYQLDMGSVCRLSNGNTLINWGNSKITEVKQDNTKAFELTYTDQNFIYRANRVITRMNAILKNIDTTGEYTFNDSIYTTGITINVSSLIGSGITSIEKHNYSPPTGDYKDSDVVFIYPYRWVFNQNGISSISGTIKLKANTIQGLLDPTKVAIYKRDKETIGTFEELNTFYDSTTGEITTGFTGFGEFTLGHKSSVNVNENSTDARQIQLYPNPAKDILFFNDDFSGKTYSIISIEGMILRTGKIVNDKIDVSYLRRGFYVLMIENKYMKFIKK